MPVALLTTLAISCTSSPEVAATLPPPDEVRDHTVEALSALTTAHFEVTHAEGGTDIGGGLLLTTVVGDAMFPGRASMRADGEVGRIVVGFGIVQIENTTYFKGPFGDTWSVIDPGSLPFNFVSMNQSVGDALKSADTLSVADGVEIEGQQTIALTGAIRSESLHGLVPGATPGLSLELTTWIGRDDGLPLRVRLTGPIIEADPPEMTRILDLSEFGESVTIEPPL